MEGPRIAAVVTEPPPGVKRKPEKEPKEEDANNTDDEDWRMFGSLMAEVLAGDVVDEVGGPSESG